jgi:hypothetical protein
LRLISAWHFLKWLISIILFYLLLKLFFFTLFYIL